ncbi:MAG: hypothetical protein GYA55_07065 [SAR324 cluster bacterium]|uniref:Lipoprotein n=1 Tax=SAR324 cluster bacterium TaxID=2024889 RepID=A0A7X9FRC9_9DELT|nr:hypothetical protein [SAR324 cluster bacterium]
MNISLLHKCLFLLLALSLSACTKSSSDDSNSDPNNPVNPGEISTDCGIVKNGKLKNPISKSEGITGTVQVVSSGNLLVLDTSTGSILVKLHGIGTPDYTIESAAVNFIRQNTSEPVTYFEAVEGCVSTVNGGQASSGQIVLANGKSLSEELIKRGLAKEIETGGNCREELLTECYNALKEESAPEIAGTINDFLWKPKSDPKSQNPGMLVILVDACDADVVVNGEHLRNVGYSNGRCSTARASKTGCAYGANVKVEVFDAYDHSVYLFPDGKPYYIIPNGCDRVEFKY